MKRSSTTSRALLTAIALFGLSTAAAAKEMYVIRDGKLIKEGLDWPDVDFVKHPFWKDWVHCAGTTVNGLYVVPKRVGSRNNHARFTAAKSALGDCEFKVVFSCTPGDSANDKPNITIADRGRLRFDRGGGNIWMSLRKQSLPLKGFGAPCPANAYDGKLHSMAVQRVGNKISFYYDGKKINEQPIDPDTNLYIWFDALGAAPKIKSMKLTAEKLSDKLTTAFKSAAPIEMIYKGSGASNKAEYGKACRYRIPALAVSRRGTILAFAEARRTGGGDIGNIDAVVRRSEDNGKTWGPEIVIWDDGARSVNNPSAVVDPKTGRIWVFMGRWDGTTPSQHVAYSDDDGKTWSKSQEMTQILRAQIKDGRRLVIPGPGSGIALERGNCAGRLVIPMNHGGAWGPSVVYSDDHGKTWKPGGALHANIGESKCAELCDGSVLFVGNPTPPETRRRLTVITEGGTKNATKLWHAEDLRHAGCQGAVERHSWPTGGKPGLLLYSGPAAPAARAQGTLRGSYDDGKTWPWTLEYYQGPSGYSDVSVLGDGRVIVLFEKDGKSHLGFTILPAPPAAPAKTPRMVFDKKIGHYKDLSYQALSDEGLSWEERTRLFGGETVHYGPLTAEQRTAKQKELQALLARIDMKLVNKCEADIRKWLDERAARPLKNADWKKDWTLVTRRSMWPLSCGVATLFRAHELFGDPKYLKAGLERADVFLRDQTARGNWRKNSANDGRYCRIQDGNQHVPFFAVLHAYRMTGDKKYFESARRCADCLLPLQRSSGGGWGDQWLFDGARQVNSGIIHGMSHNDNATVSPFMMMVTMYHMTKDKKYIANLHKLGPFLAKTNLGEGDVVGWAEGYDDNGRPLRVRRYEVELPYSKTLCRSVGFLLTWLYLMDGNEAHMELLKRAYAWHEKVRRKELESWQLEAWALMRKSHAKAGNPWFWYRPGFADAWVPDGSNWGYVIDWRMYAWYPTTDAMIKKSGKYVGGASLIHPQAHVGHLKKWADAIRAGGSHPGFSRSFVQNSAGNTLSQVRRTLLEHKRGGHKGLLKYYTNPVKYTPDQYLQARVDAAQRALDARNVRLAAMHEKGIRTQADCGQLCAAKVRWYGPKHTKWGKAYEDVILREQYPGSTAWYQWQLVCDTMLARGKVSAEAAARGGRGMEATHTHLDSWDVLGLSDMQVHEVENYFDVPIGKK